MNNNTSLKREIAGFAGTLIVSLCTVGFLFSTVLEAQTTPTERPDAFSAVDTNGDGVLDRNEFEMGRLQRLAMDVRDPFNQRQRPRNVMRRFDTNGDGQLSDAERAEVRTAMEERSENVRSALVERFDENGDGTLDETERQVAHTQLRERQRQMRDRLMTHFDRNGDNVLDGRERGMVRRHMAQRTGERREAFMTEFDTDGDGQLSEAEREVARTTMQARRAEGRPRN